MRDGIFLFFEAVTFFYENAQHLRKCYANSVGRILQCFRLLNIKERNSCVLLFILQK